MASFCREQRLTRKAYLSQLRITFETEVEEGKTDRDLSTVFFPTEAECMAEAWENYLFETMLFVLMTTSALRSWLFDRLYACSHNIRMITTELCLWLARLHFGVAFVVSILGSKNRNHQPIMRRSTSFHHPRTIKSCVISALKLHRWGNEQR